MTPNSRSSGPRLVGLLKALAVLLFLVGCGDGDALKLSVDVAEKAPETPLTEEEEWLRKQQMVRVTVRNAAGEITNTYQDYSPAQIEYVVKGHCDSLYCQDCAGVTACQGILMQAQIDVCTARLMLAIATAQAAPVEVEYANYFYSFDQTGEEAAGGIARAAAKNAALALRGTAFTSGFGAVLAGTARGVLPQLISPISSCRPAAGQWGTPHSSANYGGKSIATLMGRTAGEAYHLGIEAYNRAVEATVNASDKLLSSTPSLSLGTQRAMTGTDLSRAAAAHMLVGGLPGIEGSTEPLCSLPPLSPSGVSAMRVLRDSGLPPEYTITAWPFIMSPLSGSFMSGAQTLGTVRERLAQFYGIPEFSVNGTAIPPYYGLTDDDFQEARAYLWQERKAFSRSFKARLPADPSHPTGWRRYAGTATEPKPLPAGAWATRASYRTTEPVLWENMGTAIIPPAEGDLNLRHFIGSVHASIRDVLKSTDTFAGTGDVGTEARDEVLGGLGALVASGEYRGVVKARVTAANNIGLYAYGFKSTDRVRLVVGEDGLRCAVEGSIEGADCSDVSGQETSATYPCTGDFTLSCLTLVRSTGNTTASAYGTRFYTSSSRALSVTAVSLMGQRLYAVRPKTSTSPEKPGHYEVLAGLNLHTVDTYSIVPVVPTVDSRVDPILAPDPNGCSKSETSCAGQPVDAKLPLEDELSDDNDGIETSWKHYVGLARQAADEAELLGREYVSQALSELGLEADLEIRQEAQQQQADSLLSQVQDICGTAIDSRALLTALSTTASAASTPSNLSALYYNPVTACTVDTDCTNTNAGYRCVNGGCLLDFSQIAAKLPGHPDAERLANCLSPEVAEFITLGSAQLCLGVSSTNPHDVCPDGYPGWSCPSLAPSSGTCETPPSGVTLKVAEPLAYFGGEPELASQTSACAAFRRLRTRASVGTYGDPSQNRDIASLRASNVLLPENLKKFVGKVAWKAKYGAYATITEDGVDRFTTGDVLTGAATTNGGLSCVPSTSTPLSAECLDPMLGHQGLICDRVVCSNETSRAQLNHRMLRAVIAANLILGKDHDPTAGYGNPIIVPSMAPFGWDPCRGAPPGGLVVGLTGAGLGVDIQFSAKTDTINQPAMGGGTTPILACNVFPQFSAARELAAPLPIIREGYWSYERQVTAPATAWITENGTVLQSATDQPMAFSAIRVVPKFMDGNRKSIQDHLISGLSEGPGANYASWMPGVLRGEKSLSNFDTTPPSYELFDPWEDLAAEGHYIAAGTLNATAVLDGIELLCELAANGGEAAPAGSSPEGVATFIRGLATQIEASASATIFARVPRVAMDAMRETSPTGAFPGLGGKMAQEVSATRKALLATRESIPVLGSAFRRLAGELEMWETEQKINELQDALVDWSTISTITDRLARCAEEMSNPAKITFTFGSSALVNCANSALQIGFALKSASLQKQLNNEQLELQRQGFIQRIDEIGVSLQGVSVSLSEAYEEIDRSLAAIEGLQKQAQTSISMALHAASYQSQKQATYMEAVGMVASTYQARYERALDNARRMAFFAKRAIEQRLGVKLSDMREDLPLVEAPQSWEGALCTMTALPAEDSESAESAEPDLSTYVNGFIGDYVSKLESVVESYRIEHNFHEGDDTAVVSLRDDVLGVRGPCSVPSRNLFANSAKLDSAPWQAVGCDIVPIGSDNLPAYNCISALVTSEKVIDGLVEATSGAMGFTLQFGDGQGCTTGPCGWMSTAALVQTLELPAGKYRLSWYTKDPMGVGANGLGIVRFRPSGTAGNLSIVGDGSQTFPGSDWRRLHYEFSVTQAGSYEVGFGLGSMPVNPVTLAAPMLELMPLTAGGPMSEFLGPFQSTDSDGMITVDDCEDTTGAHFRGRHWSRHCVHLCSEGFATSCSSGPEYCYREMSFGVSHHAIESGQLFRYSGFARGNFNYRIDEVALNFVGASVRNCENSEQPTTCYSAGFVPYSLAHNGPFLVRNHTGEDYRAFLFDGRIEHARGLAAERYVTNPLSGTDRDLLSEYFRQELRGRPLDGTFVVRVWEEDGVDFDAIQDVQMVMKYRYWTQYE